MDTLENTNGLDLLSKAKRVIIKLGSALLINEDGKVNATRIHAISRDVVKLIAEGKQVALVSSGAVALGRDALGLSSKSLKLEEKQAAAAAGQLRLMRAWQDAFQEHNIPVAQALLTIDDTETRRRWLNARATLNTLLEAGAVPIVNENDTVATEEIRYGDNDRLAARVSQMIGADVLVLLSDIDGLYTADPRFNDQAKHIPVVTSLSADILAMGGDANADSGVGSGGMATKLEAARIAMTAGCATLIARGDPTDNPTDQPIEAILNGGRSTWWLLGAIKPSGKIYVDEGAAIALSKHKSLLHAGVTKVSGQFSRGDGVEILGPDNKPIARGICAYSSDDALKLIGCKSSEIESIVGFKGRPALIHIDDMVTI